MMKTQTKRCLPHSYPQRVNSATEVKLVVLPRKDYISRQLSYSVG
jgi:hypothetical protein